MGYSSSTSSSPGSSRARCRSPAAAPRNATARPRSSRRTVGFERHARGEQARTRQPLVAFVELDLVAQPKHRGVAQRGVDAAEVQEAAAALRHVDVAHRLEGHAHDELQRLPFRLQEGQHPDLVGNVVRARAGRKSEQQA
jgi:hypothetical protein